MIKLKKKSQVRERVEEVPLTLVHETLVEVRRGVGSLYPQPHAALGLEWWDVLSSGSWF